MSNNPIRIEIPLGIMFQSVNCYLIPGEQLTLIDCGLYSEDNWAIFQEKINAHGYTVNDIAQVIITHEHRDHTGLLPEIMFHSKAIIRVPKSIKGWFTQPKEMQESQVLFNQKLFKSLGFPKGKLDQTYQFLELVEMGRKIEDMDRFEFYEEGDTLRIGNKDWRILNTHGHCPNQFVFYQKEEKQIFGSDMLLPIAPMPIIVEDPNRPNQPPRSLHELLNSFERLWAFDFQTVYPGHGEVFHNANAMIGKQLDRIAVRKEECYEAIKSRHHTPYQINRKMYPYQMTPPDFSGMFMVLGYLDLLEEEGRILKEYDEEGNITFQLQN